MSPAGELQALKDRVTSWRESPPWKAGASQSCSSSRQRASPWQGTAEWAQQAKQLQLGWSHSQPVHPLPNLVNSILGWSRVTQLHFCQHSAHLVFQTGSCRIHLQGSSEIAPAASLSWGEKNPTKGKEKPLPEQRSGRQQCKYHAGQSPKKPCWRAFKNPYIKATSTHIHGLAQMIMGYDIITNHPKTDQ